MTGRSRERPKWKSKKSWGLNRDFLFLRSRGFADLHKFRAGLLEDHFLIDLPDLGGLLGFPRHLAASLFFFGGGEGNIMVESANARGVCGIHTEGVLAGLQFHALSFSVYLVLAVSL